MKKEEIIEKMKELPEVLSEGWIQKAIEKFDKSKMTIDQRMHFEWMLARNASIIHMQNEEKARKREERKQETTEVIEEKIRKIEEKGQVVKERRTEILAVALEKLEEIEQRERSLNEARKQYIINTAKYAKVDGVDYSFISEATGLSLEEIEEL